MSPRPKIRRGKLSELDKMRDKTRYYASTSKRPTGYAPLFHAALADMARLTNGHGFKILMFVWNLSLGRVAKQGQPFFEVTEPVTTAILAELSCCDERTVQRELKDMERREIISVESGKKGAGYEISPLFRTWKQLPSYAAGPVEEPKADDAPAEDEEATAKSDTRTVVTKKPVTVKAGEKSKPYPVECGVSAHEFEVKGELDCIFTSVVQNGVIRCTVEPKWNAKNGVVGLQKTNGIEESSRHGCRIPPGNSQSGKQRTKGESKREYVCDHPRAEELAAIFDPLLLRSCGKSLSGDISCLQSACEAIAATDHDFLVKAAITRGARPISSPKAVVAICKEIAGNALRAKSLPPQPKGYTDDELAAMVAQDRQKRLQKQKEIAADARRARRTA